MWPTYNFRLIFKGIHFQLVISRCTHQHHHSGPVKSSVRIMENIRTSIYNIWVCRHCSLYTTNFTPVPIEVFTVEGVMHHRCHWDITKNKKSSCNQYDNKWQAWVWHSHSKCMIVTLVLSTHFKQHPDKALQWTKGF